jgi:2-methylcitrate dehydratase PrpD
LTHSTIENMLEFKDARHVSIPDIESIDIEVPRFFLSICNIQEPLTGLEAKFSLRAVAAMALLGDDTRDIGAYSTERLKRDAFIQLQKCIRVTPSDALGGGVAVANLRLADGTALSATNDCYRPLHDLPRQRDMLVTKFRSLVTPVLGADRTEVLLARILDVDCLPSIRQLIPLMIK